MPLVAPFFMQRDMLITVFCARAFAQSATFSFLPHAGNQGFALSPRGCGVMINAIDAKSCKRQHLQQVTARMQYFSCGVRVFIQAQRAMPCAPGTRALLSMFWHARV